MTEIRIGGCPVGDLAAGSIVNVPADEAAGMVNDGVASYVNLEDLAAAPDPTVAAAPEIAPEPETAPETVNEETAPEESSSDPVA